MELPESITMKVKTVKLRSLKIKNVYKCFTSILRESIKQSEVRLNNNLNLISNFSNQGQPIQILATPTVQEII